MRIIYAGTPEFAVPPLKALLSSKHVVVAVFTQPDRPAGRGRKPQSSPVKQIAQEFDLSVYQPVSLKSPEVLQTLVELDIDLMIVAAYGLILPQIVLDIPRFGCWNIHASLLPRWRGAAPIQRAILAGDTQTGITIMQMSAGLDTGDILLTRACAILPTDTAGELHDRLSAQGATVLMEALTSLVSGGLTPKAQDEAYASYAKKLDKSASEINWFESAEMIHRKVRAFNPWPVAQTRFQGQILRIWKSAVPPQKFPHDQIPGEVIATSRDGIDVATGDGILRMLSLQLPGRKRIQAVDFLNANPMEGVRLPC